MSRLHIGVAGPCSPQLFADDLGVAPAKLPRGLGGTPVNHLVRAWLDAGHRVTLATLDGEHSEKDPVVYRGERLTLTVGMYRPRWRARNAFLHERRAISAGLLLDRPDVVSAHWSYEFALGAISTGVPTMVTVRDVPRVVFRMQPSAYRLVRWGMHRLVMRLATKIAYNSPYTRKAVGRCRDDDCVILPNSLPDASFRLNPRPIPNRDAPRLVSVNNGFGRRKNVGALTEAFAVILKHAPGASLELIGADFEAGGPAESWAVSRGLDSGVRFTGPLPGDETVRRIESSDILVHPSLEESFGYTLIEAAAVGTPVIAGRNSGAVPWVLADGEAGVLANVTRPTELAEAILELAMSQEAWHTLRSRAFALARSRFSASQVARAYVRELEAIRE